MTYDVFTLGETMIRFTPKGFTRLEEAAELEVRIGGTESNVAIALARLGLRAAWASKLPRDPLGELVARRLLSLAVDVSHVRRVEGPRLGRYRIRPRAPQRARPAAGRRCAGSGRHPRRRGRSWSTPPTGSARATPSARGCSGASCRATPRAASPAAWRWRRSSTPSLGTSLSPPPRR